MRPARPGSLKFSTDGDYFNVPSAGFKKTLQQSKVICNKKRTLQDGWGPAGLATALHTMAATPMGANQTRGNKMAKKTLKKAKKIEATKPLMVTHQGPK